MPISPQKEHVLIIKHGAFGDLIQADGVFKDIRQQHSEAKISLLTAPAYAALMQKSPYIDTVISDNRAPILKISTLLNLKQTLQKAQFNRVYDLQNTKRTNLYRQFLLKTPHWIYRPNTEPAPASGLKGLVALLKNHGVNTQHALTPNVHWMVEDVTPLLKTHGIASPYIVLLPGSSAKHTEKRWPHYAELSARLTTLGYQVVCILGPDEKALAHHLSGLVLQNLSWFSLAGILQKAAYVVGNDSGPSHVASCLNVVGLAIFGPSTSAARSELARGNFNTMTALDLPALSVDTVLTNMLPHLKAHWDGLG